MPIKVRVAPLHGFDELWRVYTWGDLDAIVPR